MVTWVKCISEHSYLKVHFLLFYRKQNCVSWTFSVMHFYFAKPTIKYQWHIPKWQKGMCHTSTMNIWPIPRQKCCSPCKGSNTTEWRKGKHESAPLLPLQENRYKGNNSYKRLLWQVNLYLFPSSKVSLVLSEQTSSHRRGGGPG